MSKIAVFFSEGFEEIEALTVVDLCRRAKLETDMVAVENGDSCLGSHGIRVDMDKKLQDICFSDYDMLVLPGGLKGTQGLEACQILMEQIDSFYTNGKAIAAVCAAPSIFGHRGILKGRKACSYPSFESHLEGAQVTAGPVEISENVITSRGMGTAMDFGLAIIEYLEGKDLADSIAKQIVYR